jgi:phosphate starvation-inducible protein PhoH and related proteins
MEMSRKQNRFDNNITQLRTRNKSQEPTLNIKFIKPLTENQNITFDSYYSGKNLLLMGSAGTGKSFLSLYLSLSELLEKDSQYKKIIIVRSAVQGRDIGFLPGSAKEKMKAYEQPYKQICTDLLGRGDAYEILQKKNLIEFECTSFLRGITFDDCIVIMDEMQNATYEECATVLTRAGKNCKLIVCGDTKQNDLIKSKYDVSGFGRITEILEHPNMTQHFDSVRFTTDDIVRSGFVKSFLKTVEIIG